MKLSPRVIYTVGSAATNFYNVLYRSMGDGNLGEFQMLLVIVSVGNCLLLKIKGLLLNFPVDVNFLFITLLLHTKIINIYS